MKWLVSKFAPRLVSIADRREADLYIGGREDTYLARWYLIPRNKWFNIYLHHFQRSDDDRALHDHPWWNLSILLRGSYTEQTINAGGVNVLVIRSAGDFKFRYASEAHRIELHDGPCWTLFITGPRTSANGDFTALKVGAIGAFSRTRSTTGQPSASAAVNMMKGPSHDLILSISRPSNSAPGASTGAGRQRLARRLPPSVRGRISRG